MLLRHTVFQFIGRGISLASGLVSIPLYLAYLGAEAYGIVGVFISLMALSGLFDLGLPTSINRHISIMRTERRSADSISRLIRSFELIILFLAALIFLTLYSLSFYIANSWLNLVSLDTDQVVIPLQLMSLAIVLRFPIAMYNGCLFAFDKHARANIVTSIAAISRILAALCAFEFYEVSLSAFFWSQIIVNALELLAAILILWISKLNFLVAPLKGETLNQALKMTYSLTGISISALLLSQIDKIILSKFLSLDTFAVYSIAYSLAMGILPIAYSIGNASFPIISRSLAANDIETFQKLIHKILTLKCLSVVSLSGVLIFYSSHLVDLFLLFTPEAERILAILPYLAIGALFQCFTVLSHGVLIAHGRPRGLLIINLIGLGIFPVLYLLIVREYSLLGACFVFITFNSFILLGQAFLIWQDRAFQTLWRKEIQHFLLPFSLCLALLAGLSRFTPSMGMIGDLFTIIVSLFLVLSIQMFRLKITTGSFLP